MSVHTPRGAIWDNILAVLGTIKKFFDKHIACHPTTAAADSEQRLRIATSAILIEMTRADFEVKPEELASVAEAVETTFAISPAETQELLRLAEQQVQQATDFYQFTSLINGSFSAEEKTRVVELMWQVAYADGRADKYEDHLVRKIASLLHVSHQDFIAAKQRARRSRATAQGSHGAEN